MSVKAVTNFVISVCALWWGDGHRRIVIKTFIKEKVLLNSKVATKNPQWLRNSFSLKMLSKREIWVNQKLKQMIIFLQVKSSFIILRIIENIFHAFIKDCLKFYQEIFSNFVEEKKVTEPPSWCLRASLVAQMVKNLPTMQETWVRSLGGEVPLEKGMAIHSSILAWRILWTEKPGKLQSMGSQRVGHDWVTNTSTLNLVPVYSLNKYSCDFCCISPATAKSLQSCPILCDPIDGSPPGSPLPRILQARTLEWVAIAFSNAWKWKVKVKSLSRVRLCTTP